MYTRICYDYMVNKMVGLMVSLRRFGRLVKDNLRTGIRLIYGWPTAVDRNV